MSSRRSLSFGSNQEGLTTCCECDPGYILAWCCALLLVNLRPRCSGCELKLRAASLRRNVQRVRHCGLECSSCKLFEVGLSNIRQCDYLASLLESRTLGLQRQLSLRQGQGKVQANEPLKGRDGHWRAPAEGGQCRIAVYGPRLKAADPWNIKENRVI